MRPFVELKAKDDAKEEVGMNYEYIAMHCRKQDRVNAKGRTLISIDCSFQTMKCHISILSNE